VTNSCLIIVLLVPFYYHFMLSLLMTGSAAYSKVTYSLTVPVSIGLLLYMDFFGIIINMNMN